MAEALTSYDQRVVLDAVSRNLYDQLQTLTDLLPHASLGVLQQLQSAQSVEQLLGLERSILILPGGAEAIDPLEGIFDLLIGSFQLVGPKKWSECITAFMNHYSVPPAQ